ncbi:MAG TPA: hypothetical protein VIU12_03430 [Chryseolinea sp.]
MHLKLGKNLSIGLAAGCLVVVLFSFGGYLLVREDRMQFGAVMFLLVPFVTGFVVSAVYKTATPHCMLLHRRERNYADSVTTVGVGRNRLHRNDIAAASHRHDRWSCRWVLCNTPE